MPYAVEVPKSAAKQIEALPHDVQQRVLAKLADLQSNPRPPWALKLTNVQPPTWRFRVGDHRVLYDIDDATHVVTVRRVAHRREIYR